MDNKDKKIITSSGLKRMWTGWFPIFTLLLGIVNIHVGLIMILCFGFPFYLLLKTKTKIYCTNYCFRLRTLNVINKISPISGHIIGKNVLKIKTFLFYYFFIALFFTTLTTLRVAFGTMEPIDSVKFMIIFKIPFVQIYDAGPIFGDVIYNIAYRLYSMLLTTFTLGTIFSVFYKPKTWCGVCPYNSVGSKYISITSK